VKQNTEKEREYEQLDAEYWRIKPNRKEAYTAYDRAWDYYDGINQCRTQYEYDWRLERALAHMHTAVTIAKETTHDDDSE